MTLITTLKERILLFSHQIQQSNLGDNNLVNEYKNTAYCIFISTCIRTCVDKFSYIDRCNFLCLLLSFLIMQSDPKKLIDKNPKLIHSELVKVVSHTQREQGEWIIHSIMIEGCNVPFKFKRKDNYQNLKGARVNITYYPTEETVAGIPFEVMNVVRIKRG